MKFLILTDHRSHTSENSLYALAQELQKQPKVSAVDIASRGNMDNVLFFYDLINCPLRVCSVGNNFVFQPSGEQFLENTKTARTSDYDWIFLRLPRPIPDGFFSFLSHVFPEKHIINRPSGIELTGSKDFLLQIPDVCPPIRLCRQLADINAFRQLFPIVLKPLREYGGKGILKIDGDQVWEGTNPIPTSFSAFANAYQSQPRDYLGMKFLKNVSLGDKRIIVANGRIIAASMRLPAPGAWMCNVAQGGSSFASPPDDNEQRIVQRISPILAAQGIFLYGLDTLADDDGTRLVSEINTLSIGGIFPSQINSGEPIARWVVEEMMRYIAAAVLRP